MSRWILASVSLLIICLPAMALTEDPFKEFIGSYVVESSKCIYKIDPEPCSVKDAHVGEVVIALSNINGNRVLNVTYRDPGMVTVSDSYQSSSNHGHDQNGDSWSVREILSNMEPAWSRETTNYHSFPSGSLSVAGTYWGFGLSRSTDNKIGMWNANSSYHQNIGGDNTIYHGDSFRVDYILRRSN